ncbi:MAG: alpha amylase C-terminal domain-containing protein [Planctomycetes bacterium]|nr:alpha amylase C-terminal domain-containing protein [Planctomycetota bacterium]MBL6996823.1 alpha amylase C-terminal domain-containing protein [Phycisphaerales bacterium]
MAVVISACGITFASRQGARSVPSSHSGYGAIPFSNSGCQVWSYSQTNWTELGAIRPDISNAASGTIKWTFPLATLGLVIGDTIRFDIATSRDEVTDPGVDHLSRSDQATDGWGTPSASGEFLEYTLGGGSGSQAFTDTIGDVFDYPSLDIVWVIVGHDTQNLYITVDVNGDVFETGWTNFLFFLDTKNGGTTENPWGRPIDLGGEEIDVFLGSYLLDANEGVSFRTWAPNASYVALIGDFNNWSMWSTMLSAEGNGDWSLDITEASVGDEYRYVIINGGAQYSRMDARSYQVTDSIGNSIVHDPESYFWQTNDFVRPAWNETVVYEMHVGTFAGGLTQAITRLDYLEELGINAIELMPIWEFAGDSSWGYNGAHPFAIESSYGTPNELKQFVDEAHARGMSVLIDVLYNHWGPTDMALWQYDGWSENNLGGIYFYNDWRAETPWGDTRPDFGRNEVREYIRDNALYWLDEYRLDGLRVDGTKWIRATDDGGTDIPEGWSLLQWINDEIDAYDSNQLIICEDLAGTDWMTKTTGEGGAGFDSQWDVYWIHPIRGVIETPNDAERSMWTVRDAVMAVYNGDQTDRVIYTESHDEVANGRSRVPEEIAPGDAGNWFARKRSTLGGALVLTSPGIPMLFQGQEFLEDGYFHDDDPLDWTKITTYSGILQLYTDLIALRLNKAGNSIGLSGASTNVHHVNDNGKVVAYHRWGSGGDGNDVIVVMNFSINNLTNYRIGFPYEGEWYLLFNSDSTVYSNDYTDIGHDTTAVQFVYDNMAYSGIIDVAPYSVQIFSQAETVEPCPADFNGDGIVNVTDLLTIISAWGTPNADITGDNMTNVSDLLIAIGEFGPCP